MAAQLLAGPILRRTTKNRVCVWLATSNPMTLQLTITDVHGNEQIGKSDLKSLNEQRVQLGKNLWVYLLQAKPNEDAESPDAQKSIFPLDTLLCYRLDAVDVGGNANPLNLSELAYGSFQYPSFFIPTKLKHLLHGSCRKPHGGFHSKDQTPMPDALSHGHTLLEKTCNDLEQRPAILLLTGDQIYADDVAISLLAMLREQSLVLTGKQETLPMDDGGLSQNSRLDPSTILLHGRKRVLQEKHNASGKNSGFSSGESENHLFTFGEFAAMYLYAFGNLPAWEPVWDWEQLERLGVAEGAQKAYSGQREPLRSYHNTLADIRRLMANVPTYMIFDDHDVTDDWNITGAWYKGVRESPLGRRIVSNALAAYWGFQAWGNDPDNFDKDLVLTIKQQLNDVGNDSDIGERYDLHTWKSRGWGFSIPTEPPIIAMDSRTQRQYDNKYYPAQLLDRYALDWLRVEWAKLKTGQNIDSRTCPVLIATTPVMGYSVVEFIQHFFLWLAGQVESYKWIEFLERVFKIEGFLTDCLVNKLDAESWSSNREGFAGFMDTLSKRMGIARCVFLSGDVHYAFTADASFKRKDSELHCYQLTSSALSNEPDALQSRFLEEAAEHKTGKKIHRNWTIFPSQYWTTKVQLLKTQDSNLRVGAKCNLGLVEFADGLAVSHTLLTGDGNLVYLLPTLTMANEDI